MDAAELCMALMRADTEDEVVDLLKSRGYWDADEYWRPIGDMENNFGTIGNQQSEAIAALVEKIVNSIDARLTNACWLAGINPQSGKAPQSIRKAVAQFFEGKAPNTEIGGRISDWLDSKATNEARLLTVTATGFKPDQGDPSITIADQGEGQTPDSFPETFMSLARSNKLRIPFVQGRFNMGGTGALQFCGTKHGLQLVVSRRNPALLRHSANGRDREWGFTLVRRNPPLRGTRSSVFTYLAPVISKVDNRRHVLSFAADSLPIFPESNSQLRKAYHRKSKHGSLVKLYEYEWQGTKSNIVSSGGGLLSRIDIGLPGIALPVRLFECRTGFRGHSGSFATNALGLVARLERNRADNLELDPFGGVINLEDRKVPLRIFLFNTGKARSYRTQKHGIVFTINGQMHGSLSTEFFRRKSVGMSYLADSLLVLVDCTEIDGRMREDLFMNSRDRLRVNPLSEKLESALERFIKDNPTLKTMRNRRQEDLTRKRLEDDKPLVEALESVLKNDPTLSRLLLQGLGLASPFPPGGGTGEGQRYKFAGKRFPTFFRFEGRQTGTTLVRDAHEGSRVRIAFETDAMDDYFIRDIDPGSWTVQVNDDGQFSDASDWTTTGPNSGVAQLWFDTLPRESKAGDQIEVLVTVSDPSGVDGFTNRITLRVKGPQQTRPGRGGRKRVKNVGDGDSGGAGSLNLPKIITVKQVDWEAHEFTEESALKVHTISTSEDDNMSHESYEHDFFVNADNKYLRHEQKSDPQNSELIEKQFTYGMVIVGLALLRQDAQTSNGRTVSGEAQFDAASEDSEVEGRIGRTTAALAPVFLPMLKIIGTLVYEGD